MNEKIKSSNVEANKRKETKFPDNFFYKEERTIRCKDVELIKNIYGKCGSYEKLKEKLEKSGSKNVPSISTLRMIILGSFEYREEYQRWMKDLSNRFLSEEKRDEVIELVSKKDHNSLHEIERITEVSHSTVKNFAQEVWGDNYEKEFPISYLSEEKRAEVVELVSKKDHDSLKEISRITRVSRNAVKNFAQEVYSDDYEKEFPHSDRLSEEKRDEVIEHVSKKDHDSLTEISRLTGVSHTTVGMIAIKIYGDNYEKEFYNEISEEKRDEVVELVSKKDHDSLNEIARKVKVSSSFVREIAQDFYGDDYEKEFPMGFVALKGKVVHSLGNDVATRSFDEKRKYDPSVPKYYSEIMIYKDKGDKNGSSKRPDSGFPNNMEYLKALLTDDLSRELGLDPEVSNRVKVVIFDLTNDLSDENIINKIIKYQHAEIMFFIVGTNWYYDWVGRVRDLPNVSRVKYPNNIRVICVDLFADLIGLEEIYREKLEEIIRLNKSNNLDALLEIKKTTDIQKHGTDELREVFKEVFSDQE